MIKSLLAAENPRVELLHVPMEFSRTQGEMGNFAIRKVVHIVALIPRIFRARLRGARILYYPPTGHGRLPLLRDIAVLIATRWAYSATVLHFHAGGLSEVYPRRGWRRRVFDLAFSKPALAIRPSALSPPDGACVRARSEAIVPYGIKDHAVTFGSPRPSPGPLRILFVGLLRESKGLSVLLEACNELRRSAVQFDLRVVGAFHTRTYEASVMEYIRAHGLTDLISFRGVLSGENFYRQYREADVFCFPTFFESENVPIVLLEAMCFGLPVVATRWRGIPDVIDENVTGFLVNPRDPAAVAAYLMQMATDGELRTRLGAAGRLAYEKRFSERSFQQTVTDLLADVAGAGGASR